MRKGVGLRCASSGFRPTLRRLFTLGRSLVLLICLLPATLARSATPVVLVHGFASRPVIWDGLVPLLRARGFDPLPVQWGPEGTTDAVTCARTVLRPRIDAALAGKDGPIEVVGHSMGGLLLRFLVRDDPVFAARVERGVTISAPHQGTRTGIDTIACRAFADRSWRPLACALAPESPLQRALGGRVAPDETTRWFSIGVETTTPYLLLPPWDGDGDGRGHGHDNAVMAEAARLLGAPFAIFRGAPMASHFRATCAGPVAETVVRALEGSEDPAAALAIRPVVDLCQSARQAR